MSRLSCASFAALMMVACKPGGSSSSSSSGGSSGGDGYVDSGPVDVVLDAGPPLDAGPIVAAGFGPFTGAYTVNGGGLLLAAQIDGHVALLVSGEPNAYLGIADAGILDGGRPLPDAGPLPDGGVRTTQVYAAQYFRTETEYAATETCGPITLDGVYNTGLGSYAAQNDLCTAGSPSTAEILGVRLIGSEFFRQDLAQSGVFDLTETPSSSDGCSYARTPPFPVKVGFSVPLDGGAGIVMVVGDGILDEIDQPAATVGGKLSAHSIDMNAFNNGSLTLGPPSGNTWTGTRTFAYTPNYGDGGFGTTCAASLTLSGTQRIP